MWLLRIQNQYKAYDITTENVAVNREEYNINVAVKNTESLQGIHEYDITTENVAVIVTEGNIILMWLHLYSSLLTATFSVVIQHIHILNHKSLSYILLLTKSQCA